LKLLGVKRCERIQRRVFPGKTPMGAEGTLRGGNRHSRQKDLVAQAHGGRVAKEGEKKKGGGVQVGSLVFS